MARRLSARLLVFVVVLASAVLMMGATAFASNSPNEGKGRDTVVGWGWHDGHTQPPGWSGG